LPEKASARWERITFTRANALRFRTTKKYDLVWSAGLFGYFDDRRFVFLLKRLLGFVACGGELVIGNFSDENPTPCIMEIPGDWNLHHRNEARLRRLAESSGIGAQAISVGREPEGVNLFLQIRL
jgi:extracellular factor (EF) 3-hydroxypalmitic acid methyl ester biosynthesis protein